MKYKQYAVKFVTLQEFVATYSDGTIKRFIFREPKKLTIKKCDGYWLINKDNIVLCDEWGDTWEEALNDYKFGVFNTYLVCNSNLDDYLYNFCEAMKKDFDKEIMVYCFTKEDMDSEDSFESVTYLISNLIVKPIVIPEEDGSYYLQYEAHINNSILIKVKTDGSVIVFDRDTDKNIAVKYVQDACNLVNNLLD